MHADILNGPEDVESLPELCLGGPVCYPAHIDDPAIIHLTLLLYPVPPLPATLLLTEPTTTRLAVPALAVAAAPAASLAPSESLLGQGASAAPPDSGAAASAAVAASGTAAAAAVADSGAATAAALVGAVAAAVADAARRAARWTTPAPAVQ